MKLSIILLLMMLSLLQAGVLPAAREGDAQAVVDISGDWRVAATFYSPGLSSNCLAWILQDGASLGGALACAGAGGASHMSGTIDTAGAYTWSANSGDFRLALTGSTTKEVLQGNFAGGFFTGHRARSDWGDVNCVGDANVVDALTILYWSSHLFPSEFSSCLAYGDVNVDGRTDALDAALILQDSAGLITRLPVL